MDLQIAGISVWPWEGLIRFVAVLYSATAIHVAGMALIGLGFGARIKEISIGALIPVIKTRIADLELSLKAFPFSGYVQFREAGLAPQPTKLAIGSSGDRYFTQLPAFDKIAIALSGCTVLILIAFILIGDQAFTTGLAVWSELLLGAFAPFSTAQSYLMEISDFIQIAPTELLTATVFAKVATYNLLPIGLLNGGMFLQVFIEKYASEAALNAYFYISFMLIAMLMLSWLVALIYFLF